MFDEIAIDLWSSWNFTCMKNIITTCNQTVRFSKLLLLLLLFSLQKNNFKKNNKTPKFKYSWDRTLKEKISSKKNKNT